MKRIVALPASGWFVLLALVSAGEAVRAQGYACDKPMAITTPEQAVARVRAEILQPNFLIGYSDADVKTLSRSLLTMHVIPLDTNEGYHYYHGVDAIKGNDAKYFWGVQCFDPWNTMFLVNRKTGFVTTGEPIPINRPESYYKVPYSGHFHSVHPYGPYYEPKMVSDRSPPVIHDAQEQRENSMYSQAGFQFSVHHYRVQERANDYVLTVLFNPVISGSPREFEFNLLLSTLPNWGHPNAESKVSARLVHVQNMQSASFVISKEDIKTYGYITGQTMGPVQSGSSTFTITKPPDDKDQVWYTGN